MPASNNDLEKRLWDAADELRANSRLRAAEYSVPVLGRAIGDAHDTTRPKCGGWAVADPVPGEEPQRVWCSECGAVAPME